MRINDEQIVLRLLVAVARQSGWHVIGIPEMTRSFFLPMAKHTQNGVGDVDMDSDSSVYSDWYVLFVQSGREEYMAEQCRQVLDDSIHARVFVPKYQVMMQFASVWEIRERELFPGYIFLETNQILEIQQVLWRIPYYKRILGKDEAEIHAITEQEKRRLCLLMNSNGVIEASYGYKDSERVEVTRGALVGHEAEIRRIDRHKRTATVELQLLGKSVKMNLGLELRDGR